MNKIVTILVAAMFFLVSATYSQTSLTISPTTITGNTGETVTVSLIVNDFTDIVSMQYGIKWDPAVIQYNSVDNFDLKDLSAGNFNASVDDGFLSFSWFDNTTEGVTAPNGTTIFTMDFVVLGDASSGSTITFASRQGLAIEIASSTTGEITNAVTFTDAQFGDPNGNGNSGNTGNAAPLISSISSTSGDNGTTVCVNVSVSNFTDITAMNYSLNWDASVLQFSDIRNINLAGLSQSSFGTTGTANGQLSVNWANATGATANNGNIYQVCYNLVGAAGTNSAVSFSSTPTPISVTTTASTTSVGITQSNGTISVNSVNPPPPPPPTNSTGDAFINISAINTPVGSTVCVPVTVNDFDEIASLQFSLAWDPAVLQFTEVTNFNLPDLNAGGFNTTQTANGQAAMAWFDNTAQGVTLADGATVFEMCFTVLGADGTSSSIVFTDTPTQREAANPNTTITFTETNGSVTVGDGTPPPPPPPTTGGDALVNLPTLSGEAGTTVCLPITVNDFNAIASLQFSLAWDPAVLQFDEVKNFNLPDLNAGSFNTTETASGRTAMAWFDNTAQGVTLQDDATLFEICFTVTGTTGASSSIAFTDVPTQREAATSNNTITFTETNGTLTVGSGNPPPPPPTPTEDGILNMGEITAPAGSNICVPITTMDFDGIAAMQFSLAWDPTVLEFTGTQNFGLTDLNAGSFNIEGTANGQIAVAWFDNAAQGITLADGTIIFELCFNVIGTNGASSSITFTDTPTARELATASGTIEFESSNGTITVGEGDSMPPTPTGDGIINIGAIESPAGSSVCIPVSVKDFDAIASMQFSLAWDPTVLRFTGTEGFGLTDLSANSFNIDGTANGQIAVAWFDQAAQGITLADGTVIFEICFEVIGADGATTTIAFTDTPTQRELATANATIEFSSSDGVFTVGDGDVVTPPVVDGPLDKLVNIAPDTISSGQAFCVPVVVHDFDDIASLQFSMGWDPSVIEFTGVQNFGIPDLTAAGFNTDGAANGAISLAWFDGAAQGVTLANGATLFEICFNAVGNNGNNTIIAFTDTPTPREAANANATVPFTQTDGIINIGGMAIPCPGPIVAVAVPTNVTCNGMNDGAITLDVSGGDENYTYTWNDATIGNIPNPTGLAAGVYSVTISSCGGQETKSDIAVASLTITEPIAMNTVITPENATCFGVADGRINVSISGGTVPYTYTWSDATLAPANRPVNAAAGTYSLTITDSAGCEDITENIMITSPTEIIAIVQNTPASCTGVADGSITLTTSGGSGGGYSYDWGGSGLEGASPTNVAAGDYTVVITDGNNCMAAQISVTVPATVVVSGTVQVVEDACGDSSGAIQVMPNGGTAPYSYNWAAGPVDIGDTNVVENVPTGNYSVTVTDANGCFYVESIEVGGPTAVLSASNTVEDVDCAGDSDGSITITAAGGFSPYTYNWSNDVTTANNPDLIAGEYTVTITDSKVCTYVETFTVGTTSNLAVTVEITKGAPDGTAVATASGGVAPYTYEWCNGQTGATATGLDEGICSLTVMDALGCTIVENVDIVVDNPTVAILVSGEITCEGLTDGILQAEGAGGKPGYTYAWNTGATTSVIANVGAGNYMVTVTDEVGNIGIDTFDFAGPIPLVIDVTEQTDDCMLDGKICINISGGAMPYKEVKWSNDVVDALCVEGLRSGDYGVIITDQNDCTKQENFRINPDQNCIDCFTSIKVMTPNDDGRNDAFIMNCVDTAPNNHLEIYNRWGQLVFEVDDYQCTSGDEADCWRGRTRSDRPVDEGGYFWVLEFDKTDGTRERIRDHVTILNDN